MIDGFELLVLASGTPSMTVTKNGVSFNKSCVEKLRLAKHVQPLIDWDGRRFAIVRCKETDDQAREFYKGRSVSNGVRWGNQDLMTTLSRMSEMSIDDGFRIAAEYWQDQDALVFDLTKAENLNI